ncbi:MAG: AAA family ATPase [Ardenticatenales bacterium]|nr:AAA family ATPase [Ardenticatenales bacterium]
MPTPSGDLTTELAAEQAVLDTLYARLDEVRREAQLRLTEALRADTVGSPQALSERDARVIHHEQQLAALGGVDERLCFGRLDLRDGSRLYIGRVGLADAANEPLLVDWRTPIAAAFYQATAVAPGEVVRRRHLTTRGREVVAVEDEVLDLDALDAAERRHLVGEGALMVAVEAPRTGRMGDIVATIQGEQDRIVRDGIRGVLVVQGGPGTGKTVVALHRTAYLLYTHRAALANSGVLLIGPSAVFLRYIERVLPSLGETGVVMRTPGTLFPGVRAEHEDAPAVARIKGDPAMVDVLTRAVRDWQRVPSEAVVLNVEGKGLTVPPDAFREARKKARATEQPHNAARTVFVRQIYSQLARLLAGPMQPGERLDAETRADLLEDLLASEDVREAVGAAWPMLTAEEVLAGLYTDPARLEKAAKHLSGRDRALLGRSAEDAHRWTVADVPLLDEAAEILGTADATEKLAARNAAARRAADVEYARDVLSESGGYAAALVSAETLADRFGDGGPTGTVAERARVNRRWDFGHVVVDEAQELSPMAWRLVMRRCRARSLTLVGDIAQAGSAASAGSWAEALAPHVGDRWRMSELTINYRTPGKVMDAAAAVLRAAGVAVHPPTSVRAGDAPVFVRLRPDEPDRVGAVVDVVRAEAAALGDRRMAVIVPRAGEGGADASGAGEWAVGPLADAIEAALPGTVVGRGDSALDATVAVLDPLQCKGLEVDVVVLIEPADLVDASARGVNDLYVALTRPTYRLVVVHGRGLPAGLGGGA